MFCFPISDHVMVPQRTVSFKCPVSCIHVHGTCIRLAYKRQIPQRTSRGLNWENKTYRLKWSISLFLSSYFASKPRDKGRMLVINTIQFFLQNLNENRVKFAVEKNIFAQTAHMITVTSRVPSKCELTHEYDSNLRPIVMKRSDANKASTKTIQP